MKRIVLHFLQRIVLHFGYQKLTLQLKFCAFTHAANFWTKFGPQQKWRRWPGFGPKILAISQQNQLQKRCTGGVCVVRIHAAHNIKVYRKACMERSAHGVQLSRSAHAHFSSLLNFETPKSQENTRKITIYVKSIVFFFLGKFRAGDGRLAGWPGS